MTAPRTLAEAQAQCRAAGVDLRVSGRGMSACVDLLFPFCPHGVRGELGQELPTCAPAGPSAAKVAILAAEAQARVARPLAPWLVVGGLASVVVVAWLVRR